MKAAASLNVLRPHAERVRCELDQWDFDPRYTDGACPICGWVPDGWPRAEPAWMIRARAVQWDFVGLLGLAALFVCLGVLVAQAAGIIHLSF